MPYYRKFFTRIVYGYYVVETESLEEAQEYLECGDGEEEIVEETTEPHDEVERMPDIIDGREQ